MQKRIGDISMERKLKNTSAQTLQNIQNSMIQLMGEMDYDKITITAISDKANISRTTFYLFYSSKKELIYDISDTFLDDYMDTFIQSMDVASQESVDRIFRQAFFNLKKKANVLKVFMDLKCQICKTIIIWNYEKEKRF